MRTIDVCLSPALFQAYSKDNQIVVIIDAVRACASICVAFINGAEAVIPVSEIDEALKYREQNCLLAGERDSFKVEGFDFGNSPYEFENPIIKGKNIVFSTTNGTQAVNQFLTSGFSNCELIIGSFLNISSVCNYLLNQDKDILILCSGWKNAVNIEDTLFAGILARKLSEKQNFIYSEATNIASEFSKLSGENYIDFVKSMSPRLKSKEDLLENDFIYCFKTDITNLVPILNNNKFIVR